MIAFFCLIFYLFAILNLFGGADAWALMFISLTIPLFPFIPLAGYPPLAFFPFTVLVNAVIFNLIAPVALCIHNLYRGNRAPLLYLFLGYPVDGDKVQNSFGYIIEDISETDGISSPEISEARGGPGISGEGWEAHLYKRSQTTPGTIFP